jgi:phosphopantothenoylcysteine synthetase/decarboxylase
MSIFSNKHIVLGVTGSMAAYKAADLASKLIQADTLLAVTALAARSPLLIAPAMDGGMYDHPTTQENMETLKTRGVIFIGPVEEERGRPVESVLARVGL